MSDITIAGAGLEVVDTRAELLPVTEPLEQTALDYYATLRSLAAQRRAKLVEEGVAGGTEARFGL